MSDGEFVRITRSADISPCGRYRWWLRRHFEPNAGRGTVCFVMLNPSTADATLDDPTIRRCMTFARRWGFGTLSVRNLFALRATDPAKLLSEPEPTGGYRGDLELAAAMTANMVVVAWGAHVPFDRDKTMLRAFADKPLYCLGTTKAGEPRHPLYVANGTMPQLFEPRKEPAA